jgi:hypothetical protein
MCSRVRRSCVVWGGSSVVDDACTRVLIVCTYSSVYASMFTCNNI